MRSMWTTGETIAPGRPPATQTKLSRYMTEDGGFASVDEGGGKRYIVGLKIRAIEAPGFARKKQTVKTPFNTMFE